MSRGIFSIRRLVLGFSLLGGKGKFLGSLKCSFNMSKKKFPKRRSLKRLRNNKSL